MVMVRAALMVRLKAVGLVVRPLASLTVTEKEELPAVLGTPVMAPLEARDRPPGRDPPARVQVYGAVPPVAWRVWEYATFTTPAGRGLVVVMVRALTMVMERLAAGDGLPSESLAVTLNVDVPAVVGVPVMAPAVERESPAGRDPDKVQV